ncbi:MAG: DUF6529 family protein [Anaerolineae bacterium]|nr:DUF6529 family protein [Anaerolineae bacterium]
MSLLMLKSVLATVVLILALGQAVSGLRLRGRFKRLPLPVGTLRIWHRLSGDAALLLTLSIAFICVTHLPYSAYSLRVPLHAALGTLAAVVMLVKVFIARRFRTYLRRVTVLGGVVGFSILGCFAASALWYFRLVW